MRLRFNFRSSINVHRRSQAMVVLLTGFLFSLTLNVLVWGSLTSFAQEASSSGDANLARIMQAPNSRVALLLPPSYQPAKLYSGFEDERRGISFVIFEAPRAAYDEMKGAFTPTTLASRGLSDGKAGHLVRQGEYVYMQARQSSPAGTYAKFFVLFPTEDQTVLVSANVPIKALEPTRAMVVEIEQALASAHTVPSAQIKDIYKLAYLGPFKEAGRVAGTSKLYTLDGRLEPEHKGASRAALIVAPSIDKRPITDVGATAKTLMQTLSGYRDITVGVTEPISISGLSGVALKGTAIDLQSSVPVVIYQVLLLAGDGGYYRLVGLVPKADADRLLPEIERITLSFKAMSG
ncbi:MAG TPA: hypothetical protein P5114_05600 [Hyphomicrobiaceae bacterium]|nr:hypothetical protein [Hyphomicrobiaceae bacterium]